MNTDDNKANYIKYNHVSDDPALIEKAQLLADRYRLSRQQQRKSNRDFEAAFNAILTSIDIFQAYDGWSLYIPLTTISSVEPVSATTPTQPRYVTLSSGLSLRAILSKCLASPDLKRSTLRNDSGCPRFID